MARCPSIPTLAALSSALLLAVATPGPLTAQDTAARAPERGQPRTWEHETSDIEPDPAIRFGHLDNGLRWAWAANPEPDQRVYLRLHVDAGSFAEADDEQGIAHLLEHMGFNGTENFPAGTLVEWFQEHGMSFGADLNAHTAFSETVYKIDLPKADEQSLDEGLQVLSDFAFRMLLSDEEVAAEKGVIDGEERERDSAGFRVFEQTLDRLYAGTRYAERMPIGLKSVRDAFSGQMVRDFYKRWYRPEIMTVVVVGDLDGLDPVPAIARHFGAAEPPQDAPAAEPAPGRAALDDTFFLVTEAEIPQVSIAVELLRPYQEEPYTAAEVVEDVPLAAAHSMLALRYSELRKKADTPFLSAGVGEAGGLKVFEGGSLQVSAEPDKWKPALEAAELELRRALQWGFRQAELDEVRADWLRSLDEAVERQRTRDSRRLLGEILAAAEERYVPTDAATDRALRKPAIEALTVEACHEALKQNWNGGTLAIYASGNLDLGDDDGAVLLETYMAAAQREVEPPADIEMAAFAYAADPDTQGEVVQREHLEDLDVHLVTFANGVKLNIKQTDFSERQILVNARVAEGLLTLAPDDFPIGFVGNALVNGAGLEAHSVDDLRRLTAGKQVGVGYSMGSDAFTLGGGTAPEDLLFQFELMAAALTHPGWRDDGLVQMRKQMPLVFQSFAHRPEGVLITEFMPALFGGDLRFTQLPPLERIEAVTVDQVRDWLTPLMADGPIEVTVVGDVEPDTVIAAAATTLGVLPDRRAPERHAERRDAPAPVAGLRMERSIQTQIPKSLVFMAFPTDDGIEAQRRRELQFLGDVVDDRLRLEVRERLGAAYAPGANSSADDVFENMGMLVIQASADPEKVQTLVDACLDVARDLAENGVTEEEVARLKEPKLSRLRDARRTNRWWQAVLDDIQSDPRTVGDLRSLDAFYETLSAESLAGLAEQYLQPERASVLVVNPEGASVRQ